MLLHSVESMERLHLVRAGTGTITNMLLPFIIKMQCNTKKTIGWRQLAASGRLAILSLSHRDIVLF